MNDDIVERLRVATVADTAESIYQVMTDAADEIERLREQIKTLVHEWELSERGVHDLEQEVPSE